MFYPNIQLVEVSLCNADIYDYGGLIIFMYAMGKVYRDDSYIKIADCLLKEVNATKNWNDSKPASVFSGKLSLAYLYAIRYSLFEESEDYQKCIEIINSTDFEQTDEYDFISGMASGIVFICNLYKKYGDARLRSIIDRVGVKLIENVNKSKKLLVGLAHGAAGPISALACIYGITKEVKYKSECMKMIDYENKYFDEKKGNWKDNRDFKENDDLPYWCYGIAGMAVSRTIAYINIEDELTKNDFEKAVKRLKKTDTSDNHGLCHGITGKIEVENWFSQVMKDESLPNNEEISFLIKKIESEGVSLGNPEYLTDYSFMNGMSGIGYAFLRLKDAQLPCILALEV